MAAAEQQASWALQCSRRCLCKKLPADDVLHMHSNKLHRHRNKLGLAVSDASKQASKQACSMMSRMQMDIGIERHESFHAIWLTHLANIVAQGVHVGTKLTQLAIHVVLLLQSFLLLI